MALVPAAAGQMACISATVKYRYAFCPSYLADFPRRQPRVPNQRRKTDPAVYRRSSGVEETLLVFLDLCDRRNAKQ